MDNRYRHLALRSGAFVLLFFLLDWGVGRLLEVFYFRQQSGLQYRTTYALEQTRADVLFFGSSRCNHHYNPLVFEKNLSLTAYNAGRDGNGLPYHYAVLTGILQRYTPKIVVLDLLAGDFAHYDESYERLSSLLPYYTRHPEIRPVVAMKSAFEPIKLLSRVYPYNSSLLTIAAGNLSRSNRSTEDIKGYLPLTATWQAPLGDLPETERLRRVSGLLDNRKVKLFESFIQTCQQRNIRLYVMVSPYFFSFDNRNDPTLRLARQLTERYKVPLWDYSQDAFYLKTPGCFADPAHLNVTGAAHYSATVASLIRETLLPPNRSATNAPAQKMLSDPNRRPVRQSGIDRTVSHPSV